MKKKIMIVIPTLRMGGAEKSLVSLLKALDPKRVEVDLFLFEAGGVLQPEIPDWVNIIEADLVTRGMTLEIRYYLKEVLKSGHFKAAWDRLSITLRSRISKKSVFSWGIIEKYIPVVQKKYDIAIGFLEGFTDFFVVDKVKATKKIGWIHSDFSKRKLHEKEAAYYGQFDELVTISEVCKKAFISVIPQIVDKICVLENIVLPEDIRKRATLEIENHWNEENVYHLVSVGRLEYAKGMDIAAKAAKILMEKKVPIRWHVYGDGSMRNEIAQYVIENELAATFILEGQKENPYPYMKQADMIVQPSRWEGKSIVLDEAKILGKAIVVTSYPSVTDQIQDHVTGLITEMEPEAIAAGIEMLIKDSVLKQTLERNTLREPNRSYEVIDSFYKLIDV